MSTLVLFSILLLGMAISMGFFAFLFQALFSAIFAVVLAVGSVTLAVLSLRE